ncbi:hypothetical protein KPL74_06005 [Bacillus sp. NP157]|nr:hypothetical protein KPL74_06005 [Bacillus sp. NP157]
MSAQTLSVSPAQGTRRAGWLAIVSGIVGLAAFACLIVFLVMRPADRQTAHILLRSHDAGVIVQSLCLIPLVLALSAIARRRSPGSGRGGAIAAVVFLTLIVALMVLGSASIVADVLYMVPQGALGVWLIVVCGRNTIGLSKGLRWLGVVAGVGLVLVGVFPIGYAWFVDPAILHGPISDNGHAPAGTEKANQIIHILLAVGTLIGCPTYPLWSALTGRWMLLRGHR